jgi:hypothetical protein
MDGGGKFLTNAAVSILRLDLSGAADNKDRNSFTSSDIVGSLRTYNYLTRTLIESVSFSSLQGILSGSDLTAMGQGMAMVNGVLTDIDFVAASTRGVITFQVRNAASKVVLAGGTGETGRAALGLIITPP